MKTKHILINTLQLILLTAFFSIAMYVTNHFTIQNIIVGAISLLVITIMKDFLKKQIVEDIAAKQPEESRINDKILQLLRYSFIEGDEVIQYKYLTERERNIVSEAEYKIILQRVLDKNPLI